MRMLLVTLVASSVAACANDVTAPTVQPAPDHSMSAVNSPGQWAFGRRGVGMGMMFAAHRLPANLKLTDIQRSQIKGLVAAYRTAHKDDLSAMASVAKQAFAARRAK